MTDDHELTAMFAELRALLDEHVDLLLTCETMHEVVGAMPARDGARVVELTAALGLDAHERTNGTDQ